MEGPSSWRRAFTQPASGRTSPNPVRAGLAVEGNTLHKALGNQLSDPLQKAPQPTPLPLGF
jgi:hypothetical protein